jgi:hypothetical protein
MHSHGAHRPLVHTHVRPNNGIQAFNYLEKFERKKKKKYIYCNGSAAMQRREQNTYTYTILLYIYVCSIFVQCVCMHMIFVCVYIPHAFLETHKKKIELAGLCVDYYDSD